MKIVIIPISKQEIVFGGVAEYDIDNDFLVMTNDNGQMIWYNRDEIEFFRVEDEVVDELTD